VSRPGFSKGIRGWLVALAALVCMALTARLGYWQLDRAAQKQALQNAMQQQSAQAAWDNAAWRTQWAQRAAHGEDAALLHHPVQLVGRWQAAHTVYLDNRQMQGRPGFYVLTPLLLEGGGAVLVQRGWVPRNFQDRTLLPAVVTPTETVRIEGRVAAAPSPLYALGGGRNPDPHPHIRQNLDMDAFARETSLPLPTLGVVQTGAAAADGLLRDWPAPDSGISKHYGYAFQWFGLCALVAVLYLWFQLLRPWRRAIAPN